MSIQAVRPYKRSGSFHTSGTGELERVTSDGERALAAKDAVLERVKADGQRALADIAAKDAELERVTADGERATKRCGTRTRDR